MGILQSLVEWSRDLYVYPGVAALAQRTVGIETAFPLSREGRTACKGLLHFFFSMSPELVFVADIVKV